MAKKGISLTRRQKTIVFLLLIILFLSLLEIKIHTDIDELNVVFGENNHVLHALQVENMRLMDDILKAQALTTINEKARKQGMNEGPVYFLNHGEQK